MTQEALDDMRKRLRFRSWHRGTRELDLIMGTFADRHLDHFDAVQLGQYEEILTHPDPDLYNWITGAEAVPANYSNSVMALLVQHSVASHA
jgi:antitoxin CptB